MTENAETPTKVAKKRVVKKAAARKPAAKKATARKAPAKRVAKKAAAPKTAPRGRPPGKKVARKPAAKRGKKAKQFAYQLLNATEGGEQKASAMNGPFSTEADALDDASIMADDSTTIVLFREAKRGRVQKSTKFVAGR